jgi:hypothetical protein
MDVLCARRLSWMEEEGAIGALAQLEAQFDAARKWLDEESGASSCPVQWRGWCLPRQQAIWHSGSGDTEELSQETSGAGPKSRISAPAIEWRAKRMSFSTTMVSIISPRGDTMFLSRATHLQTGG